MSLYFPPCLLLPERNKIRRSQMNENIYRTHTDMDSSVHTNSDSLTEMKKTNTTRDRRIQDNYEKGIHNNDYEIGEWLSFVHFTQRNVSFMFIGMHPY